MCTEFDYYKEQCDFLRMQIDLQHTLNITRRNKHSVPKSVLSKWGDIEKYVVKEELPKDEKPDITHVIKKDISCQDISCKLPSRVKEENDCKLSKPVLSERK